MSAVWSISLHSHLHHRHAAHYHEEMTISRFNLAAHLLQHDNVNKCAILNICFSVESIKEAYNILAAERPSWVQLGYEFAMPVSRSKMLHILGQLLHKFQLVKHFLQCYGI